MNYDYKKLYERNQKEVIRLRNLLRKANISPGSSEEELFYVDYDMLETMGSKVKEIYTSLEQWGASHPIEMLKIKHREDS